MSKPLELTIYPYVDRWVEWTMEFLGKPVHGGSRECGYETPRGIFCGDEFPEKRLTDAELAAEFHAMDCERRALQHDGYEYRAELNRAWKLYEFATLPHYDEAPA